MNHKNPHLTPLIDQTDGWHSVDDNPPSWWLLLHDSEVGVGELGRYYIGRYTQEGFKDLRNRECNPTHWHILPDPFIID